MSTGRATPVFGIVTSGNLGSEMFGLFLKNSLDRASKQAYQANDWRGFSAILWPR
jgi:hypothetical protein